jgi:hypothetical protein
VPSGPIGHSSLIEMSQEISEKTSEASHDLFQVGGNGALDEAAAALDLAAVVLDLAAAVLDLAAAALDEAAAALDEVVVEFREHTASLPDTASSPAKGPGAGQTCRSQPLVRPISRPGYVS